MRFAPFEDLKSRRLWLRKITREDIPAYFRLFGSSEVSRYMLWEPHTRLSQSEAAVEKVLARYEDGRCYRWGIARKEGGELIGIVELLRFEEASGACSFAYMLREDCWGRGYGTEALEAAFAFAFGKMDIRAIQADHFAENPASGAVMRKVGMTKIGILPGKYEKEGKSHDAVEYRITKEEWKKTHGAV